MNIARISALLTFIILCTIQTEVNAQCIVTAPNGMSFPVAETTGPTPAWAATYFPNGTPVIVYGPTYFNLPPLLQRFTSLHECGHATSMNPNEFAANCFALMMGNFSIQEIIQIRQFYQSLPGQYPPQYGGSGPAFWAGTIAMCPQFNY